MIFISYSCELKFQNICHDEIENIENLKKETLEQIEKIKTIQDYMTIEDNIQSSIFFTIDNIRDYFFGYCFSIQRNKIKQTAILNKYQNKEITEQDYEKCREILLSTQKKIFEIFKEIEDKIENNDNYKKALFRNKRKKNIISIFICSIIFIIASYIYIKYYKNKEIIEKDIIDQ